MSLEENKAVVRRHFEQMWNQRDLSVAERDIGSEFVEHGLAPITHSVAERPDPVEGMKGTIRWLLEAFPDLHFTVEQLLAEGDEVLAYVTMRGTHMGPFQGLPPTGRRAEAKAMHLFRLDGGQLREHWAVREDLWLLQQLGLTPGRAEGSPGPDT